MKSIKFNKLNKKITKKYLLDIVSILKIENKSSILSSLNNRNIYNYLQKCALSQNFELFTITRKGIIGYALLAAKPKYLIKDFEKYKLQFFFSLLLNLKFASLFNVILSKLDIDKIFISQLNKKIISESINLNLLGIKKEYQSQGLGKKFLNYIFKNSKFTGKFITCETDNHRAKNFYLKKNKFKFIGKKVRFPQSMSVFNKKIN